MENGQTFDVTDPEGAEALYLDEGERYVDATVTVYYLLDADTAPNGAGWYSITVDYDADDEVETIGGVTVAD